VRPALLPLDMLGAVESAGAVTFGLWLPWVSAADGNRVSVKIIHEHDQFLQDIAAGEFAMSHALRAPHGDFWSVTIPIAGTPPPTPRSAWGQPGSSDPKHRCYLWVSGDSSRCGGPWSDLDPGASGVL
jgi:maltooligosyltrehalose trehalohydrolase